jgi:hypothetical protein
VQPFHAISTNDRGHPPSNTTIFKFLHCGALKTTTATRNHPGHRAQNAPNAQAQNKQIPPHNERVDTFSRETTNLRSCLSRFSCPNGTSCQHEAPWPAEKRAEIRGTRPNATHTRQQSNSTKTLTFQGQGGQGNVAHPAQYTVRPRRLLNHSTTGGQQEATGPKISCNLSYRLGSWGAARSLQKRGLGPIRYWANFRTFAQNHVSLDGAGYARSGSCQPHWNTSFRSCKLCIFMLGNRAPV